MRPRPQDQPDRSRQPRLQRAQRHARQLLARDVAGRDGRPHAGLHQLPGRARVGAVHDDVLRVRAQQLADAGEGGPVAQVQDQRHVPHRLARDGIRQCRGELLVQGQGQDQLLLGERDRRHAGMLDGQIAHPDLRVTAAQRRVHARGHVRVDDVHDDVRMPGAEPSDEVDQRVQGERRVGDEVDAARLERAHRGHFRLGVLDVGEDAACGRVEPAAHLGELQAAAGALEQRRAEALFQRADGLGKGRLRDIQRLCGLGDPAVVDNRDEVGQ